MSLAKKIASIGTVVILMAAWSSFLNGQTPSNGQAAPKSTAPVEAPITEQEMIKLVKHNKKQLDTLAPAIESRGVDFEISPDVEKDLRKAGADDMFIANVRKFTPSARAAKQSNTTGPQVTPEEAQAYNLLKNEKDPEKSIQLATDFAQKFPKSQILTYVYALEAEAYQQKNDAQSVYQYGQKSLDLDPNNLMSLLMVGSVLAQPQMMNVDDAEKEKRLNAAEGYANKALQLLNQLPKQPKESDATYQKRKDLVTSGVYASLGMVHLERSRMALEGPDMSELTKAEQNYKNAIAKSENPNPADYYRLGEVYSTENRVDDAIAAFSKAGQLAQGTVIQKLADQQVQTLKQKKSEGNGKSADKH